MALPYIFSASFDTGDNSEWDSEADTGSLLDFPHYTTLARLDGAPAPYRGAYCMRVQPGDTNDHTLTEGDIDISAGGTAWTRFALYISSNFAATADDIFNIFELQQAGGTVETAISLQITAATNLVEIGIGETEASTFNSTLEKGVWHQIELSSTVDAGTTNNGTSTLYVNGNAIQTVSSLDQGAVGQGVLGTQGTLATTSTGYLLFDEFAFDDTRIGITHRFATHRIITTSSFLFMGSGQIGNVKIIDGGGGDATLQLYDADVYNASLTPRWYGQTATANVDVDAADVPIDFSRGCLAILAGTTPAAQFYIQKAKAWGSDGAIRTYAMKRHPKGAR